MRIREEQNDTFRKLRLQDFENRACTHLRQHLAAETEASADDDMRQRVRSCIPRASAYGLTSERHVIAFVDATYLLGESFDTDPKHRDVVGVLRAKDLDANQRAGVMLGLAYGRARGDKIVKG